MEQKKHYRFGQMLFEPYQVSLQVDTDGLTIEQFKADLPRIIAKLETFVKEAIEEADQAQH